MEIDSSSSSALRALRSPKHSQASKRHRLSFSKEGVSNVPGQGRMVESDAAENNGSVPDLGLLNPEMAQSQDGGDRFIGNLGVHVVHALNVQPAKDSEKAFVSLFCRLKLGDQTQTTTPSSISTDLEMGMMSHWNEEFSFALYAVMLQNVHALGLEAWGRCEDGTDVYVGRSRIKLRAIIERAHSSQDVQVIDLKLRTRVEQRKRLLPKVVGELQIVLSPDIAVSREEWELLRQRGPPMIEESLPSTRSTSTCDHGEDGQESPQEDSSALNVANNRSRRASKTSSMKKGTEAYSKHSPEELGKAAIKIQATYRRVIAQREYSKSKLVRRVHAAVRLQAIGRGYITRTTLRNQTSRVLTDDEKKEAIEAEKAAERSMEAAIQAATKSSSPETWPLPLDNTPASWKTLEDEHSVLQGVRSLKEVRVMAVTWNMCARPAPEDLSELIPVRDMFHIYAIGTEECENSIAKSMIFTAKKQWESLLKKKLGPQYVMLCSHALQAIHHAVFIHRGLLPLIRDVKSAAVATGFGNQLGNKGGVGITFRLANTSLLFINSHLEAGQKSYAARNEDFHKINAELDLRPASSSKALKNRDDVSSLYDCVIWSGDLNYRLNGTRALINELLNQNQHKTLLQNDQLRMELSKGAVFKNFKEGPLNFRPTYKYDENCDTYDTSSKARIPSWTDRILYHAARNQDDVTLLAYNCVQTVRTSDHRPVYAIFRVQIQIDNEHQLNHDAHKLTGQSTSEVCCIQ